MKPINIISAVCENKGIGIKNDLPWRLSNEYKYFQRKTSKTENSEKQNAVVMGRRTWESLPPKFRPLKNRLNVVISNTQAHFGDGILNFNTVEEAVNKLENMNSVESIWIAGGKQIYEEALNKKLCDKLYITRVKQQFECDTFFPDIDLDDYQLIQEEDVPTEEQEENGIKYEFTVLKKKKLIVCF